MLRCSANGPRVVAVRRERVLLEQIVDRDRALVLDVGARAADRSLVERHRDEAVWTCGADGRSERVIAD